MSSSPIVIWLAQNERWIAFHGVLLVLLTVEFTFARWGLARLGPQARARRQRRTAIRATVMWIAAALLFAGWVLRFMGSASATQFLAAYAMEEALSVDNLFLFLLLFRVFAIPPAFQPRVLFWGVAGAFLLRGGFIAAGVGLLNRFEWISYVFAVIMLAAAVRLVLPGQHGDPASTKAPTWVRWISKIHPVSLRSDVFFTHEDGRGMVTMLFLSLLAIETADIIFALDSIPAVLSITRHPFIAYTSNIMAVMGLRSLFFLLADMLRRLRYLHFGLSAILAFAALKMLLAREVQVGPVQSLLVIVVLLAITVAASLWHGKAAPGDNKPVQD
jgi:tellurite resistance protein TerC